MFNVKKDFVPKVIQKSSESTERITKRLSQAFMFSCLEEHEKKTVVGAMEERTFAAGEDVITQGDDGDVLYVVDRGELDCYKKFGPDEEPKHLKVYVPGESFGELALLYNAPRAATIRAKTESVLFALDRDTFNAIVKVSPALTLGRLPAQKRQIQRVPGQSHAPLAARPLRARTDRRCFEAPGVRRGLLYLQGGRQLRPVLSAHRRRG
jgi:CRP-like cAMP-binding protein